MDYYAQGVGQSPDEKRKWERAPQQEVHLGVGVVVRQGTDVRGDVGSDQACISGVEERAARTCEMTPGRKKRPMVFDIAGEGGVTALGQEIDIHGYGGAAGRDGRWVAALICDLYLRLFDEPRFAIARPGGALLVDHVHVPDSRRRQSRPDCEGHGEMSPSSDTQAMCPGTGHGIGEEANGVLEISQPLGARKPFVIGGPEPDVQFVTGSVIDLWRVPGLEAQAERRVGCLDSLAKRRDPVPDQTADQCQQTIALGGSLIYTAQGA